MMAPSRTCCALMKYISLVAGRWRIFSCHQSGLRLSLYCTIKRFTVRLPSKVRCATAASRLATIQVSLAFLCLYKDVSMTELSGATVAMYAVAGLRRCSREGIRRFRGTTCCKSTNTTDDTGYRSAMQMYGELSGKHAQMYGELSGKLASTTTELTTRLSDIHVFTIRVLMGVSGLRVNMKEDAL